MLLKDGKAYVQARGDWVNVSEPEAEFQEMVNKRNTASPRIACSHVCLTNSH